MKRRPAISDDRFLRYALREVAQHSRTDGATAADLTAAGLARYKPDGRGQGLELTERGRAALAQKRPATAMEASA